MRIWFLFNGITLMCTSIAFLICIFLIKNKEFKNSLFEGGIVFSIISFAEILVTL